MSDELDLYGHGRWGWKAVAIGVAVTLVLGGAGYRWVTTVTPVDSDEALRLFHAELDERVGARSQRNAKKPRRRARTNERRGGPRQSDKARRPAPAARPQTTAASGQRAASTRRPAGGSTAAAPLPQEGVYSWDTRGWEQVGGARRSFPRESQRIITREGRAGWMQHHYFSREREIWTRFRVLEPGVSIAHQRNKVTFGPVTNDSSIDFAPPMLVGPTVLRVGQTWKGSWSGDTHGDYRGRTFEHRHLNIGGTKVEVWGVEVHMRMDGEMRGTVEAKVWIAPEHGLTVREAYVQNVQASVGTYRAEWSMTLKSLNPRQ